MDIYFTIKISCNRKVQVCFCANFKVLMLCPLLLTLWSFSEGTEQAVRSPRASCLLGLWLPGLWASSELSWWPWRQPLWRKWEENSARAAPTSLGSCFYAKPFTLDSRLSYAAEMPQTYQCLAMSPAELDPSLTWPWPSWSLQPQQTIRTLDELGHHPQACCTCWVLCPACCAAPSPGAGTQWFPQASTTRPDTKSFPQTLLLSPQPHDHPQLHYCLPHRTYRTPDCKWPPAQSRFGSGLVVAPGRSCWQGAHLDITWLVVTRLSPKDCTCRYESSPKKKVRSKPRCPVVWVSN